MAFSVTTKCWFLLVALFYVSVFSNKLGNAYEDLPETGSVDGGDIPYTGDIDDGDITHKGDEDGGDIPHKGDENGGHIPDTGGVDGDPAQVVSKALLCFDDKAIYSSCEESFRLNEGGNINVSPEETDVYCNGPCLEETHLVLNCIDSVLSNFLFYNKATVQDIRETLHAGCSYTNERGEFNVAEHIGDEESSANKARKSIHFGFILVIIGCVLLI